MIDLILDLLPDETGEYIGATLMGGATYLYLDTLHEKNLTEKQKAEALKQKIRELSETVDKSCLSPEAMAFLKEEARRK